MSVFPKPEYLRFEDVRKKVDEFLNQYHPSREIPIPIDEIIEKKMNIRFHLVENLKETNGIEAFTECDLKGITIDSFIFWNREKRIRFTVAHELGHIVLHRSVYENANFKMADEWIKFYQSLSSTNRDWFEKQAKWFAGLILVPKEQLHQEIIFQKNNEIGSYLENKYGEKIWIPDYNQLSEKFQVSNTVIQIRVDKENLLE